MCADEKYRGREPGTPSHVIRGTLTSLLVPKGARDAWAGLVADLCTSIGRDTSDLEAWKTFFMAPRCILANPTRGGRTQWRETQRLVKSRIRRWQAGDFSELWDETLAEANKHSRKKKKTHKKPPLETLRKANARRARRAVEDGQYRKAIQSLSSGGGGGGGGVLPT